MVVVTGCSDICGSTVLVMTGGEKGSVTVLADGDNVVVVMVVVLAGGEDGVAVMTSLRLAVVISVAVVFADGDYDVVFGLDDGWFHVVSGAPT